MRNSKSQASMSSSGSEAVRYTVHMPIDGPVDSIDDAVHQLLQCDPSDLRRARRHHRRALSALERGSYETLADDTRTRLVDRLRTDLEALDRALNQIDASRASLPDDTAGPLRPGASSDGSGRDAASGANSDSEAGWSTWLSAALW